MEDRKARTTRSFKGCFVADMEGICTELPSCRIDGDLAAAGVGGRTGACAACEVVHFGGGDAGAFDDHFVAFPVLAGVLVAEGLVVAGTPRHDVDVHIKGFAWIRPEGIQRHGAWAFAQVNACLEVEIKGVAGGGSDDGFDGDAATFSSEDVGGSQVQVG